MTSRKLKNLWTLVALISIMSICAGVLGVVPFEQGALVFKPGDWSAQGDYGLVIDLRKAASSRLPHSFPRGSDSAAPTRSTVKLSVNGVPAGPANANHAEIRDHGGGAFSHWGNDLLFSAPATVGSRDKVRSVEMVWPLVPDRAPFVSAAIISGLSALFLGIVAASVSSGWHLARAGRIGAYVTGLIALLLGLGPDLGRALIDPSLVHKHESGGISYVIALPSAFPDGTPLGFPLGDSSASPYLSSLRIYVDGLSPGFRGLDHATIRARGLGYSHWGNILHFSMPDGTAPLSKDTRIELTWPIVPRALCLSLAIVLLGAFAKPGVFSARQRNDVALRPTTFGLFAFNSRSVAVAAALILSLYAAVASLAWAPSVPLIELDTSAWLGQSEVVPPYYGLVYGAVDNIGRALGYENFQAAIVLNALAFFGAVGLISCSLALRSPAPWSGPLLALLIVGDSNATGYVYHLLTEAPAMAIIITVVGCLIMARSDRVGYFLSASGFAVAGYALRPSLVFLLPLVVVSLLLARASLGVWLRVAMFLVAGIAAIHAWPLLSGRPLSSQLGIVLYAHVYHLVPPGAGKPTPDAIPIDIALSNSTESLRLDRAALSKDEHWAKQNLWVLASSAAQLAAGATGLPTHRDVNAALSKAALKIIYAHPVGYISHVIENIFSNMQINAGGWRDAGMVLADGYRSALPAAKQLEEGLRREGLADATRRVTGRALKTMPPLFELTGNLITPLVHLVLFWMAIVSGVMLSIFGAVKKLQSSAYIVAVSANAIIGYLLCTGLVAVLIPRYVVPAELLLLVFTAALTGAAVSALSSMRPLN
jgi:hypothetical protein